MDVHGMEEGDTHLARSAESSLATDGVTDVTARLPSTLSPSLSWV